MIISKEKVNSSHWFNRILSMFLNDKLAFVSIIFLIFIVFLSILGPSLINDSFIKMNLRLRNLEPFSFEHHFMYFFGADALGRSMIARLIVATQNTIFIAGSAVFLSMTIGGVLGLISGYFGGKSGNFIMRIADIIMSFPSLLLAVIVLYMFDPGLINLVIVLAFTRMPIYMRTARAEVLEIRERLFVSAAISMGASDSRVIFKHIAPLTIPTLITIATLDFAFVMLGESALSFLGVGIQPPEVTWGLMVAQGRNYLQIAWWLAFFPGLMIMLVALSLNLLSSWLRIVLDPMQRWRLENIGDKNE
ncbi:ABC transporter permease [Alphaproteobacteria bacterium]|jgi:peptide/nickel transport system permease protein|nr:ABC transporter permease [Alphaproteobacteria bacterium]